jgi:hypothetical protein
LDSMAEQIAGDVLAAILVRERVALVNDATDGDVSAGEVCVGHMLEVTVSVRIMERAVFAECFPVVTALNSVQHAVRPEISGVDQLAFIVEIQAPGIAAAFAKQLEAMSDWMITPNTLLKFDAVDFRSDGAALTAIEPAIGSPGERIRDRVGVFHAESGEQYFGVGIGHVVAVAVGIKQEVGDLQNENATVTKSETTGEV